MIRSVLSILAGYVLMAVLIMVATVVSARLMLHVSGVDEMRTMKPTVTYMIVNLGYSGVFAVLGGFAAAALAKRAPLIHALILAVIMIGMGIALMFSNTGNEEPGWYSRALLVLGPGGALLGGYLQSLRHKPSGKFD